ncbi:hypothetical protein ADL21_05240 [Streptomyces albus subsp. albus]|nr:hypothetical protein ADL21_05240 [Streptomyces albus subsp. albus]
MGAPTTVAAVETGSSPMRSDGMTPASSPNLGSLCFGTSSVAHLRENVAGVGLSLSDEELAELDKIGH